MLITSLLLITGCGDKCIENQSQYIVNHAKYSKVADRVCHNKGLKSTGVITTQDTDLWYVVCLKTSPAEVKLLQLPKL